MCGLFLTLFSLLLLAKEKYILFVLNEHFMANNYKLIGRSGKSR